MTSTNDGKDVKSNQTSDHKGKSYYIELYKALEKALSSDSSLEERTGHVCEAWRRVYSLYQHSAPTTHPHLLSWLQRHTAHTVLQSKWAESKNEQARLTAAIDALVAEAAAESAGREQHPWERLLLQRAAWFRETLGNPWGHPVLKSLINPNANPVTDQQVLEWLIEERGIVLVTRLRQLVSAGNCDDLALLLAAAVMDRARAAIPHRPDDCASLKAEEPEDPESFVSVLERDASFTVDVWELLTDIELVLLLKTDKRPRCIELAKLTPLRHGYAMVERLRNRLATSPRDKKLWKHAKEVATLVTQVIIARCMVLTTCSGVGRTALYCCARSLARLVPSARLPAVSNTLAAPAHTARHLHTFCTALDAQCSEDMKPFICELYVRAITAGMNELEQFKLNADKASEARSMEQTLATWFTQLGTLLAGSARLRAECALTAFSVHPARNYYERVAAIPPPATITITKPQEPSPDTKESSEFGSWANDSRTQSNLVKTSETLQLKKTEQHQANVLSTAILTEGETLGLEPELCQDLAVLLSGPRVKTLSWDMDREVLLENCRGYMVRTDGGTRAVTTELKYLNLDPDAYRHLPEEEDDESDIYYGIEKGYEHEVQLEDPEEIWQNAFFDPEQTESANDSEIEQMAKKKVRAPVASSEDDEDPLSTIADAKKEKKKLAKEKRKKKSHKRDTNGEGSKERRKNKDKKTKKESKKDKSEQTTGSLTSLLGMKVSKMPAQVPDGQKKVRKKKERRRDSMFSYVSVTDSDYDSQVKSLLPTSDPNILVDGVFSMDELKSPESEDNQKPIDNTKTTSEDNQKPIDNTKTTSEDSRKPIDNRKATLTKSDCVQSPVINNIKSRSIVSSPRGTTSSDSDASRAKSPYLTPNQLVNRHVVSSKVKSSISKLLQFRRKQNQTRAPPKIPASSQTQGIIDKSTPKQSLVGMKIFNREEISKAYTHKKELEVIKKEANNVLNANEASRSIANYIPKIPYNDMSTDKLHSAQNFNVQKPSRQYTNVTREIIQNVFNETEKMNTEYLQHSPLKSAHQSNYMTSPTPSVIQTNYSSPTKAEVKSHALNLTPPKPTMTHQTFHKSMQNLSTDNIKQEVPKKPLLINDPNYFSQQHAKTSQVSPRIISNTIIKPPSPTGLNSQVYKVNIIKQDLIKSALRHTELNRTNMSKGSQQNVSSQNLNSKSNSIKFDQKQLSSSMHNVDEASSSSNDVKRHILTRSDMLHGSASQPKLCTSKPDMSYPLPAHYSNSSSSASRCIPYQNRMDPTSQQNGQASKPGIGLNSHYEEFLKELAKSINAGSINPDKNVTIALNNEVKITPVASKRADSVTRFAKQTIQQKKTENAPNTFSRLSYMHKNKQNETKVSLNDAITMELNKNILDHKVSKAKYINNEITISKIGVTHPNVQDQGNVIRKNEQTKSQKTNPVLTGMLGSPIKNNQTCSNLTNTSHSYSDTQADREHADLLLLLRNQPVVKTNPSSSVNSTSEQASIQISNTQTKIDPVTEKALVGAKVKNINTVLNTLPLKKESTLEDKKPQEWEQVMSEILAHKTEPLGPNALDMVLKKDYKRHSQSSSRPHTIQKSIKITGDNTPQSKPSESKKRDQSSTKTSSLSRKPSTEKLSEISKKHKLPDIITKTSSNEMFKRFEVQDKHGSSNTSKNDDPFISGIPNSAYDVLGDLMDDDLRQELGELSSDEEAYRTPNVSATKVKSITTIPKTGTTYKVANVAKEKPHDVGPKTVVCKTETTSNLVRGTIVNTHPSTGYTNVIANNTGHVDATRLSESHIDTMRLPESQKDATKWPESHINATRLPESRPTLVCSNTDRPHTATVITNQIVQHAANITNHNIDPNCFIGNIEPANVIIASLPVPVPAQPVVVIRQDVIYDSYSAIHIHETQVTAGLCSVNQSVYAINNAPNIAVYQTTQFAAPVINPVIIGNAMTTTNVSNAVAMAEQQVAPDCTIVDVNTQEPDSTTLAITDRPTEDGYKPSAKSTNLDLNMNRNCERKVLSQVQEKHPTKTVAKDSLTRRLSDNDKPVKTQQDEERIKLKRQSLMNRKISHACFHPPIPLAYTPLSKNLNSGKLLQQETSKNGTVQPNNKLLPNIANGIHKYMSVTTSDKEIGANNENIESTGEVPSAKEKQKKCRRIWLRSSKVSDSKASPEKRTKKISINRNKIKLKVSDTVMKKITNLENENIDNLKPTRTSSRILNKKKLNVSESNKSLSPLQAQHNCVADGELIDFEEELSGSKIMKTSITVPISDEALNEELVCDTVADDMIPENNISSDFTTKEQGKLDYKKETATVLDPKKLINNSLEPTVVIEKIKNDLGDQLLIRNLTVKEPTEDPKDVAIKKNNRTALRSQSVTNDCVTPHETCVSNKMTVKAAPKNDGPVRSVLPLALDKRNKVLIASPIVVLDKAKLNPEFVEKKMVKHIGTITNSSATTPQKHVKDLSLCANIVHEFEVKNNHSPTFKINKAPLDGKKSASEDVANKVVTRSDTSRTMAQNSSSLANNETQTNQTMPLQPQLKNVNYVRKDAQQGVEAPKQTLDDTMTTPTSKIVPNNMSLKEANTIIKNLPSLPKEKSLQVNKIDPEQTVALAAIKATQTEQRNQAAERTVSFNDTNTTPAAKKVPSSNVLLDDKTEEIKKTDPEVTLPLPTNSLASGTVPIEVMPERVNEPAILNNTHPKVTTPLPTSGAVPIEVMLEKMSEPAKRNNTNPKVTLPIPTNSSASRTVPIEVMAEKVRTIVQDMKFLANDKRETVNKTNFKPTVHLPSSGTLSVDVAQKANNDIKSTETPIETLPALETVSCNLTSKEVDTINKETRAPIAQKDDQKVVKQSEVEARHKIQDTKLDSREADSALKDIFPGDIKNKQMQLDFGRSLLCDENVIEIPDDDCSLQSIAGDDKKDENQPTDLAPENTASQHNVLNQFPPCVPKKAAQMKEGSRTIIKDAIKIEELPSDSKCLDKKRVRITLSNGKVFKATITGQMHGDFNTLFSDPAITSLLAGGLKDGKYTLNYRQISETSTDNPAVVLSTKIKGMNIKPLPVDTINLISDDEEEEETRNFDTEFGKYRTNVDLETYTKHQKRFDQKCIVKLCRENIFKSNKTKSKTRSRLSMKTSLITRTKSKLLSGAGIATEINPNLDSNTKTKDNIPAISMNTSDSLDKQETLPTPPLEQVSNTVNIPEVIEIDDESSNDSADLTSKTDNEYVEPVKKILALKNLLLQDLGVETLSEPDKNILLPVKNKPVVDDLKNALLHDLGVVAADTSIIDITSNEEDDKVIVENPVPTMTVNAQEERTTEIRKLDILKDCVVNVTKCDYLVRRYELRKAMKKCYVQLVRLNDIVHETAGLELNDGTNIEEIADTNIEEIDDTNKDNGDDLIEFNVEETYISPQLSRCPSLSILNSWDDEYQPSTDSPSCSSPVMDVYDAIVQLRGALGKTELLSDSKNNYTFSCVSEWRLTKLECRTQEIYLSAFTPTSENEEHKIVIPDCDSIVNDNDKLALICKAPKLSTLTLEFLERNPDVLYIYRLQFTHNMKIISESNISSNKLKRKTDEDVKNTVASKILKLGTLALNVFNSYKTVAIPISDSEEGIKNNSDKCIPVEVINRHHEDMPSITEGFDTEVDHVTATEGNIGAVEQTIDFTTATEIESNQSNVPEKSEMDLENYGDTIEESLGSTKGAGFLNGQIDMSPKEACSRNAMEQFEINPICVETEAICIQVPNDGESVFSNTCNTKITLDLALHTLHDLAKDDLEQVTIHKNSIITDIAIANAEDILTGTLETTDNSETEISVNSTIKETDNSPSDNYQMESQLVEENGSLNTDDVTDVVRDIVDDILNNIIQTEKTVENSTDCVTQSSENLVESENQENNKGCAIETSDVAKDENNSSENISIQETIHSDSVILTHLEVIDPSNDIVQLSNDKLNNSSIQDETLESDMKELLKIQAGDHFEPKYGDTETEDVEEFKDSDKVTSVSLSISTENDFEPKDEDSETENVEESKDSDKVTSVSFSISTAETTSQKIEICKDVNCKQTNETEASNIVNITNSEQYEIPIEDLFHKVYEVEIVDTGIEDGIDTVEPLSLRSPEPVPITEHSPLELQGHDLDIKSPVFVDSKQIIFNYHDYTKRPKRKENISIEAVNAVMPCVAETIENHVNDSLIEENDIKNTPSSSNLDLENNSSLEETSVEASETEVNSITENYPPKSETNCKYELIQDDDWLTVIKTENDKDDSKTSVEFVGPNDVIEEKTVIASLCSKNATINIKGFEYDDIYVFPLSESGSSNTSNDSIDLEMNSEVLKSNRVREDLHDIDFSVIAPKVTYTRKCLKRKIDMRDVKVAEKKYRKGKNIDCPKLTATSMAESAYGKEYKRLLEYCSSVKFSYSRPFHKELVEVQNLASNWPINSNCSDVPGDVTDDYLFTNVQETNTYQPDPATQTLAEEISYEYANSDTAQENPSNEEASIQNFNMGFGEGSGRVIQILKKGGESNISAATLSDVKQSQPVFKSVDYDFDGLKTNTADQIKKIRQHVNFIELRDKVRSFFMKSSIELKSDWLHQNIKDADIKTRFHAEEFPFDLCSLNYVKPIPTETIVQVVQVGQLPVSAAAQNPVTCDPRVTQVSDASPSQCSVDNIPNDDSQSEIKTEYTELTTADLTLPLQEYAQQNQANMNLASHDCNVELTEQTISLEMEIKAEESPEIREDMPDIKEEKSNSSDTELHTLTNATPENVNYSFENNTEKSDTSGMIYDSSEQNSSETFSRQRLQNGTSEKTDQIAHAMNAAGITTTPETITNTRAHALVNILSQKIRQGSVNNTQTVTNTYSKTTSINAMALQQALAQILPPPLNQTGSSENNQSQSTSVGPQVLHIVQGKNASGNQITLVDNSQQSVISTPNATQVLHIVQNKSATPGQASNGTLTPQANSFSGLSLVDAGIQQGGNQLLHIVNTGNQKTANPGQLLKRVNLLTNLTNVQGSNEQKMVQFVCKSADGKAIQLNAPHQRSMVLRLQPIETPNVQTPPTKPAESQELSSSPTSSASKDSASQQEIKSRSIYEENYAKFIQNSSSKIPGLEKSTSLPKFNQAFGKPVFQEGSQKQGEAASNNSHLPTVNTNTDNSECTAADNAINLEHIRQISSPPLLLRKQATVTTQSQPNIVQQLKQTIAPMNIQTMHGGVIYTRQIPVNIGGGQTINLITVPSTELINDDAPKPQTQTGQGDIESSIIKIVPQSQTTTNSETSQEESNNHASGSSESTPAPQPQPVLTQMRIKLPMLSKAPQMVPGARVVRPSFFQIQRNVIGGSNQPVYQQLVLTAAPPLGQQTIRLPQAQASRPIKVPSESQSSSSESQMSSSTLEQLREFDMVLEQVKERSTVQPSTNTTTNGSFKIHTSSSDTTDGNASSNCSTESTSQVLYSIGNNQSLNVAYVNRKTTVTTSTTSTYVRSPDSSGIADSPTSLSHVQIPHTVTTDSSPTEMSSQSKPAKVGSKSKSRPKSTSNPPNTLKLNSVPPKTSSQKPLEDEQTTQRILYILAEYKEQVENSPDKDKPAPRRRSNPPSNPGSSKRKKSSSSRRSGTRDMSPVHGEDTCRTMGSEDSSCGTSQGDCTESCLDSHSPQDSPRKVARKITFDQDLTVTQPRPQPQRNVIVADGQTITVARGTTGKPATAVLMPANYILPVSMVKGGQQIAIVTNRGPKLLTVGGEGGATNALLLQRLIGPAGLKPVLTRPGVRHVRLPTAALHNLQAFNLATATTVQPPDSTASPTPGPTPPELSDTRATSSPWTDRDDVKPERGSSPEGSEPWNLPSSADSHQYTYEETVRTDSIDRTVLVVQKKDGSQRQHRLSHVSAAALRHKYAILEHELRLQKSLSEECEDLGVDSPSASELFPEAELLFAASPAHEHNQDAHHPHTPQPLQSSTIPQPDLDDQIATDHLIPREIDVGLGLGDVGIIAVSEDGMQATIALDQEEFARSHPNTTFHSEPTDGEVQPFTITGLKGRHITSTIFHSNSAPATVLMAAPQATVISQAPDHGVKYEIENMSNSMPSSHNNDINLSSVLVKDDGLTRFDNILTDSRELHLTNTASAIVHSSGNATQVIRRVCYEDDKRERDTRYLIDEPDNLIAGDDAKMIAEDSSRDATLESMADVDDDRSSPERHAELFWESNSASERSESRRPLDFSSDSDKCCKSPSFDETNSTDSSGVGTHMRLDSVIKEARGRERSGSADGSSADDAHPPLRTYPPKRPYHPLEGEAERSLSGKTRAGERSPDSLEVRRRASGRGVVKRGCHCCNGSPAPARPKKPRQRKPTLDFNTNT